MTLLQVLILAAVQGAAELLPVSSSAHVIVTEKLMGLDPSSPEMTLLLVMLHTGTMFAVIAYFWQTWRKTYFSSTQGFVAQCRLLVAATMATGAVGLTLQALIKHFVMASDPNFEIEHLFANTRLMAAALASAGVLILYSSRQKEDGQAPLTQVRALVIGAVQGLCLPFRGFSRSGATISTGMAVGVNRQIAEEFSFAMAVVLTPAILIKEALRLHHAQASAIATHAHAASFMSIWGISLIGMGASFVAGLLALRWLSSWLEQGRWHLFGFYCLFASAIVLLAG
ncbi:MAG: undecaprenyl-diphosphate phosphatase [Burkholderiales bacterium]|nr:MAG: undecaprenyl-diphosphate phosphatase [Burkholderiales bacterium]